MGKNVNVKYVKQSSDLSARYPTHAMTIGNVYEAYIPEYGEEDPYGVNAYMTDEVWIAKDDDGEPVVVQLSDGLEIVQWQP